MMRSGNPVLREDSFAGTGSFDSSESMTIQGAVNKSFILLFLVVLGASWTWADPSRLVPLMWPFLIAGFTVALVTVFKQEWSPVTAPLYAVLEGLVLGGISAMLERIYPEIVIQAVALTFGTLFCLLMAYKARLIQVTERFKLGVVAATGGIAILYIVDIVMGAFGHHIPFIHESGVVGIGFSVFIVIIASLNLVIDFDFIEKGAQAGAPRYMEWYGAFSLMVTLVWLYLEIINLLSKIRRR